VSEWPTSWRAPKREHPYQVPGVSARPIIDGNPDYLAWIAAQTDAAITA